MTPIPTIDGDDGYFDLNPLPSLGVCMYSNTLRRARYSKRLSVSRNLALRGDE
jgi:hypothetical protein